MSRSYEAPLRYQLGGSSGFGYDARGTTINAHMDEAVESQKLYLEGTRRLQNHSAWSG